MGSSSPLWGRPDVTFPGFLALPFERCEDEEDCEEDEEGIEEDCDEDLEVWPASMEAWPASMEALLVAIEDMDA